MHNARLFINGRSQAVRIPKSMAFEGVNEVTLRKEGNRLIIEPARKTWTSLKGNKTAGNDFMKERPGLIKTDRVKL